MVALNPKPIQSIWGLWLGMYWIVSKVNVLCSLFTGERNIVKYLQCWVGPPEKLQNFYWKSLNFSNYFYQRRGSILLIIHSRVVHVLSYLSSFPPSLAFRAELMVNHKLVTRALFLYWGGGKKEQHPGDEVGWTIVWKACVSVNESINITWLMTWLTGALCQLKKSVLTVLQTVYHAFNVFLTVTRWTWR